MAGTLERIDRPATVGDGWADLVFRSPLWLWATAAIVLRIVSYGLHPHVAIIETQVVAFDPFTQHPAIGAWNYQSPTGPLVAWLLGWWQRDEIMILHLIMTFTVVIGTTLLVARCVSDLAGRLFVVAYFCSPVSWGSVARLGIFDIITIGALSVAFVGGPAVAGIAGVLLGFHHFEHGLIALGAVAVIRTRLLGQSIGPCAAAAGGLVLGKLVLVVAYQLPNGIATDGRAQFLLDHSVTEFVDIWRDSIVLVAWTPYALLWVPIVAMLTRMRRPDSWIVCGLHVLVSVPALMTFDVSRVYRSLTWPIVMLAVVWWSHAEGKSIRRNALVLAAVAFFIPHVEIG